MSIAKGYKLLEKAENKVSSTYKPTPEELVIVRKIVDNFTKAYQLMYKPRPEFDDLCLIERIEVDRLATNTYLRNNGELEGEDWWRSTATKPVIRSKVQQICAYAVSKYLFPTVRSRDEDDYEQEEVSEAIKHLIEYVGDKISYKMLMMEATYTALSSPVAYVYKGYQKVKRTNKHGKQVEDEYLSGHIGKVVQPDQIFIPNVFERNIQLQDFVIWRNIISYDTACSKYETKYPKFSNVKPGIVAVLNDANQLFYNVYDTELNGVDVEEVLYWSRKDSSFHIMVNGVLLTDSTSKNQRDDGLYPFETMGYSLISSNFAYYKSLAHSEYPNAKTLNEMWRMLTDASFLSNFPPMISRGGETITNSVIVPGGITDLKSPDSNMEAINLAQNLSASVNAVKLLEESIEKTAPTPMDDKMVGNVAAYTVAKRDQQATIQLGLFYAMIADFVIRYGRLMLNDILQYETLGELKDGNLKYNSYNIKTEEEPLRISFDGALSEDPMSDEAALQMSSDIFQEENEQEMKIMKANPKLLKKLKYDLVITPEQINAPSEELKRFQNLEIYDRSINNPMIKLDAVTRDMLFFGRDGNKYVKTEDEIKQEQEAMMQQQMGAMAGAMPGAAQTA